MAWVIRFAIAAVFSAVAVISTADAASDVSSQPVAKSRPLLSAPTPASKTVKQAAPIGNVKPSAEVCSGANTACELSLSQHDKVNSLPFCKKAAECEPGSAFVMVKLGDANNLSSEYVAGEQAYLKAIQILETSKSDAIMLRAKVGLGNSLGKQMRLEDATKAFKEAASLAEALHNKPAQARAEVELSKIALVNDPVSELAAVTLVHALKLCQEIGELPCQAETAAFLGRIAARRSVNAEACKFWQYAQNASFKDGRPQAKEFASKLSAEMSKIGCETQ